jgi:hypothetical protein
MNITTQTTAYTFFFKSLDIEGFYANRAIRVNIKTGQLVQEVITLIVDLFM